MGKFVTYGVTETLDNDQKFIIDSDRTGPGSITAKDAASSLLSKWAGFDTFEEAVQNTISNNQEFIDRDTAIRNETAELKKKIVTTFPAKDASGAVATFESEFEDAPLKSCIVRVEPVQDLHGYDSPWPAGGGTNQWDEELEIGSFDSHGNPTTSSSYMRSKNYIPLIPNATYYFTRPSIIAWVYYYTDTDYIEYVQLGSGVKTFTPPSNATRAKFLVATSTYGTTYNHDIAINYPSSVTTYSPYSNECPITGWTGCEVQRTGVNIFDKDNVNALNAYIANYKVTTNVNHRCVYIPCKPNTTYTVQKICIGSGDQDRFSIGYTVEIPSNDVACYGIIHSTSASRVQGQMVSLSITTGQDAKYLICWISYSTGYADSIATFQLELGSAATDYEPYKERTYPITFPTESGTIYGGYVDVTGGELVVNRAIVDLGTLSWLYTSGATYPRFSAMVTGAKGYDGGVTAKGVCSAYPIVSQNEGYHGAKTKCIAIVGGGYVWAWDSAYTDAESFKTAMTGVQLCYELAEPIHYSLSPIEIRSLLGQNNIWANTGNTAVEYLMSDVSWYVEKKLRAFQSVLAGVEDSAVASKNYSTNSYLIFNDDIYRATKAITAGETIEEGVNVTKTTVAEQLMALAQA